MATSRVIYQKNLRTHCIHVKSGDEIVTDAPTDNHGKGEAFSPTDLCASSLASCMLTVMGIKAASWDKVLDESTATVTKVMADNPRRIAEIIIEMLIKGSVFSEKEQKILMNTAHSCPVAQSLHPDIFIKLHVQFV